MNTMNKKIAAILAATVIGGASLSSILPAAQAFAAAPTEANAVAVLSSLTDKQIQAAVQELAKLGIMEGYADNTMGEARQVTRAELAKLLVKTFDLKSAGTTSFSDVRPEAWYADYVTTAAELGVLQANGSAFDPRGTVTDSELTAAVAKALGRDLKSVEHWMSSFYSFASHATRGEAAYLLQTAHRAIPSEQASITDVRSLNAITLIVTFDKPLTAADEVFAKAKTDFSFNGDLTLTNMPRLKTGSVSTYIVPTSVQQAGTEYSLTYKGQNAGSFQGSGTKLAITSASQVTNDTFELASLQANGVVDYGYIISAYSGGRGANAFVLDDNEQANGKTFQIISSMQARQVTITPEGGAPIVAKYVPFTQSTDGKQEPKFRLPEGQQLEPGVKYTVTSDWADIAEASFTAGSFEPLQITSAKATGETSIEVTLAQDPGDELFSGRSVTLTAPNGDKLTATYKYSSRKGATGVFDLANNGKLAADTVYTIEPAGDWAVASDVTLGQK
ncbi:S-layer homology domain-containing protein [Paenibacillus sp. NPDC058071]|uniref:S-layer homology domain-containing protein n=1 Tax=Paenibacillus sp. NPDC058071 TaxID=3346326 RepID=UPI0036DB2BFC